MQPPSQFVRQFATVPPNHSGFAWLTCLFCCWPLGLAAIIKSNEVSLKRVKHYHKYVYIHACVFCI